jgi:hypothetical protein
MNYLTRPVFELPVNWAGNISRSFSYDLRDVPIGFGAEIFTGRGLYVVNGWTLPLELPTEADIVAFEEFTDALKGRLLGFWLPVPMVGMEVAAAVSATQFDIIDQGLRDTWTETPDIHLALETNGVLACAKITAVALVGNYERVTIDTALSPGVNTTVSRLHYVRMAEDAEPASFVREHHQQREVRVIELPTEYTTAETGERPIYLYHFWASAPIDYHWYYTSFEADVISGDKPHRAGSINHGSLRNSTKIQAETLEITAGYEADHPFSLFLPVPISRSINVTVSQCSYADPDTVTRLFTGQVRVVNDDGTALKAQCDSFLSILKQRIPAMLIQGSCIYQVFDPRTCKALRPMFQTSGHILEINNDAQPPRLVLSLRFPSGDRLATDYFALGFIETGMRLNFEQRSVFLSSWNAIDSEMTLELNAPLLKAVVGQEVQLIPGCDGLPETCKEKFLNFKNFPGHRQIPADNPSFKAIEGKTSAGDKK